MSLIILSLELLLFYYVSLQLYFFLSDLMKDLALLLLLSVLPYTKFEYVVEDKCKVLFLVKHIYISILCICQYFRYLTP